jgi:hypothetical protein
MLKMSVRPLLAFAVLGVLALQLAPAAAQEGIGAASTISNRVEGFVGTDARTLAVGSQVFQNELVRTSLGSDAKLVFLDATNLSVGPSSEVTLDRFVYDPDKGAGAVVVRTTRGLFRFITGSQKPQNYLISTPLASIGVRGTIFDLLVAPDRVTVLLIEGQVLVTTLAGQTVTLSQPGTSVTVYLNGSVVGPTVWTGSVYVDFASTSFPYFPPVTNLKRKAAIAPPIRTATGPTQIKEPRRFSRPGYRVASREQEPQVRVRVPHIKLKKDYPRSERPRRLREAKMYPKMKMSPKTYPRSSSFPRRPRHY